MKIVIMFSCLFVFTTFAFGQEVVLATSIVSQIEEGRDVVFENLVIEGNLDFTTMDNPKKAGRYGVSRGVVQEYIRNVNASVVFKNCVFRGEIITYQERKEGRELMENFTRFWKPMSFTKCQFKEPVSFERMSIKKLLTVNSCIFQKTLSFHNVKFSKKPTFTDNIVKGRFTNKSNWKEEVVTKAKPMMVHITLENPTNNIIKIKFGNKTWSLSPNGSSGLLQPAGVQIYILEKSQKRLALTLNKSMQDQKFDISTL